MKCEGRMLKSSEILWQISRCEPPNWGAEGEARKEEEAEGEGWMV